MHSSIAVANRMMEYAQTSEDSSVTPMQLIKLVYLAHGWMYGLYGRPLIKENVEAWRYGPVIRSLYDAVKQHQYSPVSYPVAAHSVFGRAEPEKGQFDQHEEGVIKQTYDLYGSYDGVTLSSLTHQPGSPWSLTWDKFGKNAPISNDLIEHHFAQLYRERSNESEVCEA